MSPLLFTFTLVLLAPHLACSLATAGRPAMVRAAYDPLRRTIKNTT